MRQRPVSVTVFGILNIGFGVLKYCGLLFMQVLMRLKLPGNSALAAVKSDPSAAAWNHFSVVISILFGIVLIASGIGLLLMQSWSRLLAVYFSVVAMLVVLAGAPFSHRLMMRSLTTTQWPGVAPGVIEAVAQIFFAVGIVFALAYPVLLLVYMTRPRVVEAFTSAGAPEIN
jgi:hypothetical protein